MKKSRLTEDDYLAWQRAFIGLEDQIERTLEIIKYAREEIRTLRVEFREEFGEDY